MENREIIVANTKTQRRNKIVTSATTLAELKRSFDDAGIDYAGMTFTEGISKTQLLDDATQLPQNVMYKGHPTNNLVILLTNTKKNIASGIQVADRHAAYSVIKERGLQEDVKETFGRNFTQVPTSDLQRFIEERTESDAYDDEDDDMEDAEYETYDKDDEEDFSYCEATDGQVYAQATVNATLHLLKTEFLKSEDVAYIVEGLKSVSTKEPVSTSDGSINDEDIDNMIKDIRL